MKGVLAVGLLILLLLCYTEMTLFCYNFAMGLHIMIAFSLVSVRRAMNDVRILKLPSRRRNAMGWPAPIAVSNHGPRSPVSVTSGCLVN